jgi:pimeloyl-ACP methyl ester carboxylesterase
MKRSWQYNNGSILAYAEYGDPTGDPILVQHGLIASIDDGNLFEQLIKLGTRLICIARPGYGESSPLVMANMAEWGKIVSGLVAELGISRCDVLGMSSGAPYSYAIGRAIPDIVRNIFIFSGTPALYDLKIRALWPYQANPNASMTELQILARGLFFSNLSSNDLNQRSIKDSLANNCFGVAQDLRLRFIDWGFTLDELKANVFMEHSKEDKDVPFSTALLTSQLLPKCKFSVRENGPHFSQDALENFIASVMAEHYGKYDA